MKPSDQQIATAYKPLTNILIQFRINGDPTDWEEMDKIILASNKVRENLANLELERWKKEDSPI